MWTSIASRSRQSGYSIVSLLIGAAFGVFLAGVAGKSYIDSRVVYAVNDTAATAYENGRFAIDDIRRSVVMAGNQIRGDELPFGVPGVDSKDAFGPNQSDKLTVIYGSRIGCTSAVGVTGIAASANRCQVDCLGNPIDASTVFDSPRTGTTSYTAMMELYVNEGVENGVTTRRLMCRVNGVGAQPLVSGVETFQVMFGLDPLGEGTPNQYVTPTELKERGTNDWQKIAAIRIAIVASSAEVTLPAAAQQADPTAIAVLGGETYTPPVGKSGKLDKVYKSYVSTILLRNLANLRSEQQL